MGKGDQRTRKGKRVRGSYGKTRVRKSSQSSMDQMKKHIETDAHLKKAAE